jgi:hypothetical protein
MGRTRCDTIIKSLINYCQAMDPKRSMAAHHRDGAGAPLPDERA